MGPEVVAAVIAASVSFLTLIGTLAAQYFGRRATKRDLEEQRKQLDRTLAEQRTRTLNERFATAAGQLGSDKPPAVRLAGAYAMAGLADDWPENRQACVDVLCGYLRMPYEADPGQDAPGPERLAFRAGREVRHTVIRVIAAHLRHKMPAFAAVDAATVSWEGLNFDFTGVVFDGGDFDGAQFTGGRVNFAGAEFAGGTVSFNGAAFAGSTVYFNNAQFTGGRVSLIAARFTGGWVFFNYVKFARGTVSFYGARFSGGTVNFDGAAFARGTVDFDRAEFSGGTVNFDRAQFTGGKVKFGGAQFTGGTVNFGDVNDWSHPPVFPWTGTPPPGVVLPEKEDQSQE